MLKKCVYCRQDLQDKRAVDICDKCGIGVWGQKMFKTILQGMNNADEKGDLCLEHEIIDNQDKRV